MFHPDIKWSPGAVISRDMAAALGRPLNADGVPRSERVLCPGDYFEAVLISSRGRRYLLPSSVERVVKAVGGRDARHYFFASLFEIRKKFRVLGVLQDGTEIENPDRGVFSLVLEAIDRDCF